MANLDIGIDLGTANILVHVRGRGVVLNEPSVIAYDKESERIVEIGEEARAMLGRTPGNLTAIRPLKHGVISEATKTEKMLKYFIQKCIVNLWSGKRHYYHCPVYIGTRRSDYRIFPGQQGCNISLFFLTVCDVKFYIVTDQRFDPNIAKKAFRFAFEKAFSCAVYIIKTCYSFNYLTIITHRSLRNQTVLPELWSPEALPLLSD